MTRLSKLVQTDRAWSLIDDKPSAKIVGEGRRLKLVVGRSVGGEDGHLRVFKWPSMDIILNQTDAHTTVKHVDFSSDGKFLVSLGGSGPCRVWDLESSTFVTNLQVEEGEKFCFCRFSESSDILYVISMHDDVGKVISWSSSSWKRISLKKIGHDPISAFSVSYDGKFLAIGTVEGDIAIINSSDFKVQMSVKKAHLGLVTALEFSQDSRALVSTSFDSTARVTVIENTKNNVFFLLHLIGELKAIVDIEPNGSNGSSIPKQYISMTMGGGYRWSDGVAQCYDGVTRHSNSMASNSPLDKQCSNEQKKKGKK